jgi:nucleotide-binding universal stress UspA family protein
MSMGPIICCLDDSEGARRALTVAEGLSTRLGLELVLVHVEPPTSTAPGLGAAAGGAERLRDAELREGERLLERLASEAGLSGSRRRTTVGPTAACIVSISEEERAELVVIGSRGHGELATALLGSVSTAVAASAPCPCVIVPPGATTNIAGST